MYIYLFVCFFCFGRILFIISLFLSRVCLNAVEVALWLVVHGFLLTSYNSLPAGRCKGDNTSSGQLSHASLTSASQHSHVRLPLIMSTHSTTRLRVHHAWLARLSLFSQAFSALDPRVTRARRVPVRHASTCTPQRFRRTSRPGSYTQRTRGLSWLLLVKRLRKAVRCLRSSKFVLMLLLNYNPNFISYLILSFSYSS